MIDTEITNIVHDYIERGISCDYDLNCPKPPIYIKPVKLMTLRDRIIEEAAKELQNEVDKLILKEDNEMKPTSVWEIENIDEISITQDGDEISLLLKNRDDLTKITLTGDAIKNHNDNFVTTLKVDIEENAKTMYEQDQKIRELKEENENLKKAYDILDKTLDKSQKACNKWYEKYIKMQSERDSHTSTRVDILDQAKKCVCGQREQDYGTPESNFQLIADLWNGYLGTKYRYPDDNKPINVNPLKPLDVSMMMALLKIARIRNGGGSGDSFVDLAGYAACGGEIWVLQKETN